MNQWDIRKVVKKGQYLYAIIPEHPGKTENNYVLLHRAIMENSIGRLLLPNEVVHHINEDKKDCRIENLQLMWASDHNKAHQVNKGQVWVTMKCPQCNKIFERAKRNTHLVLKKNKTTCCSNECRGKLSRNIQLGRLSIEAQQIINNPVIDEYKNYKEESFDVYTHTLNEKEVIPISLYTIDNPATEEFKNSRVYKIINKKERKKKEKQKNDWIDEESLRDIIWKIPTTKIAELYGVSDSAVGKKCKKWKINKPPRGYWEKIYHKK